MMGEEQKKTGPEYLAGHKHIWPDCEKCGEPSHRCKCEKMSEKPKQGEE